MFDGGAEDTEDINCISCETSVLWGSQDSVNDLSPEVVQPVTLLLLIMDLNIFTAYWSLENC